MANLGSALHFTSYFGNLHLVKYLIKNGADVNYFDKYGRSPLHYAIVGGNLEIVKCLIKSNANVNFCDIDVKSPLNYASYQGHLEIVNCLLKCGADVNCGASCVSAACSSGQYDVIELLIDKIDINRVDDFCDPPLHSAASSGHVDIVKKLIEHGADVNLLCSCGNPLYCATQNGHLHIIEYLMEHGANVNQGYCGDKNTSLLCCASSKAREGHVGIVKYLINRAVNVNVCDLRRRSPLYYASARGYLHIIKCLIQNLADLQVGANSLSVACSNGHHDAVEYLIDKADVNRVEGISDPPMHSAASSGHLNIVEFLVKHGADVNLLTSVGNPLYCATKNSHLHVIEYLVKHGANINQGYCGDTNTSPLCCASSKGYLKIVKELVRLGADVNLNDKDGRSPLFYAVCGGHLEIVKYLISSIQVYSDPPLHSAASSEQCADVNHGLCDDINTSPLCCASSKGYLEIVKALVKRCADVNICNLNGDSPLCYASRYGHLEIVKFLLQNNADFNIGVSCLSAACDSRHLDVVEYLGKMMDVNKVYDIRDRALHHAAGQGHIDIYIVKYVVEAGVNVNLLSFYGYSPLCCAVENGHLTNVEYLVEHGAHIEKAVQIAIEGDQNLIRDFLLKLLN
ncbi:ankyrin repeat domain-containing protein 50-like [Saccostrea cucullata]|uniref:ankyrin repeat domain-containing protein 50-like n=1 Tax=Saccostrea cuccullata TaxID=36930 RepID=UPI002ED02535